MATKNPIKIVSKTMFINVEFDVELPQISTTLCKQICVYKNDDGTLGYEVDTHEYRDLMFMGKAAPTDYKEKQVWDEKLKSIGINIYKIIEEVASEILTPARIKNIVKTVNLD